MIVLIEEPKKEHSEIVAALNEVKELGILSKEGQAKLLSVKEHLLIHLKKEAEHNESLKNALDLCAIDMENVSRVMLEFFDKYSRGVLGKELQREFENLCEALGKRMTNEEDVLYEEYDMMNQ
jgi:hypothetical protein